MRLDKYLKVSRLIKRRTVANEVADAGRILINGKTAKASQAVKAGDIIEVTFGTAPISRTCASTCASRTLRTFCKTAASARLKTTSSKLSRSPTASLPARRSISSAQT